MMVLPEKDNTLTEIVLECMQQEGFDGFGNIMTILINAAMKLEREKYLRASAYERTEDRHGYANGYKDKTVKTRIGTLALKIPQTRDGFYPSSIEKGIRSERALKTAIAEMYIQGVSTRKVTEITEALCGTSITSAQVSKVMKELDEVLIKWRDRPIGYYQYLFLDARYEKVRVDGTVVDVAVLIAKGVNKEGQREIIGVSISLSEAEVHWREFFESLVKRGLHGIQMIISDAHSGLQAARMRVFPAVPWQRCQFHLQQNAQAYITKQDQRTEVANSIRHIFNAQNKTEAQRLLKLSVDAYQTKNVQLSQWLETNIPEGFTVFDVQQAWQKKLRTTNPLERVNKEIKRRTKVVGIFPNTASCLRLISALLMETSEDWQTGHRFLPG